MFISDLEFPYEIHHIFNRFCDARSLAKHEVCPPRKYIPFWELYLMRLLHRIYM